MIVKTHLFYLKCRYQYTNFYEALKFLECLAFDGFLQKSNLFVCSSICMYNNVYKYLYARFVFVLYLIYFTDSRKNIIARRVCWWWSSGVHINIYCRNSQ